MQKLTIFLLCLAGCSTATQNFFSFKALDIKGQEVDLADYKGKVTLLVNTASQCSLTDSHFKALKRLHDILSFGDQFNVLAVPSNDFGDQEPWDEPEVEEYVRGHFKAEFPLLGKTKVIGSEASDLWKWVAEVSVAPDWNFNKYLINREGVIVKHWPSDKTVESIFTTVQNLVDGKDFIENTTQNPPSSSEEDNKGDSDGKDEL